MANKDKFWQDLADQYEAGGAKALDRQLDEETRQHVYAILERRGFFKKVYDLVIPTGTEEQKAHQKALDELRRERNRKAVERGLDDDIVF